MEGRIIDEQSIDPQGRARSLRIYNATALNYSFERLRTCQAEIDCSSNGSGITFEHKVFAGARMKAKHETQNNRLATYLDRECARFAGG
jgi:hypothetical protein